MHEHIKDLCTVNTHDSVMCNLPYIFIWLKQRINTIYNPAEEPAIKCFRHGISHISCFVHGVCSDNSLPSCYNTVGG